MTALRTVPATRAYADPDSGSARLWRKAQDVLPGGNPLSTAVTDAEIEYFLEVLLRCAQSVANES